jgi:hypothetical protein
MMMVKLRRAWCQFAHRRRFRGTVGLAWYGNYCPKCGYSFFVGWTDYGEEMLGQSPGETG